MAVGVDCEDILIDGSFRSAQIHIRLCVQCMFLVLYYNASIFLLIRIQSTSTLLCDSFELNSFIFLKIISSSIA